MTTSDYALIISIVSIFVSIGALIWNIWQKFIFVKPALQASFGIYTVLQPGGPATERQRLLSITATNMGPGSVILHSCIARKKGHWWRRAKYGFLNPIHSDPTDPNPRSLGPFSSGLPAKIREGEIKSFYFPFGTYSSKKGCRRLGSMTRITETRGVGARTCVG